MNDIFEGRAPMVYVPGFMPKFELDAVFARLLGLPWSRYENTPRLECYFNDHPEPYTYGSGAGRRTYQPQATWHRDVLAVRVMLEHRLPAYTGQPSPVLDVCFCNMYRDHREHLGWHADDTPEMDDERPVVTVSFGAARPIWVRPRGSRHPSEIERVVLEPGSALIMMPGMQDAWDHRIPKAGYVCGPRVSLTFRGYVPKNLRAGGAS